MLRLALVPYRLINPGTTRLQVVRAIVQDISASLTGLVVVAEALFALVLGAEGSL